MGLSLVNSFLVVFVVVLLPISVVLVVLTLMLTGGWRSDAHDVYKRANFAPSDRCAASMHDNSDDTSHFLCSWGPKTLVRLLCVVS
jgi:sterol desaturase/sphingolipid hydroxylase (fatty acid hydroxylase superfamily)